VIALAQRQSFQMQLFQINDMLHVNGSIAT